MLEMACSMPYEQSLLAAKYPKFKMHAAWYWLWASPFFVVCH
jgi:hypothetical protein